VLENVLKFYGQKTQTHFSFTTLRSNGRFHVPITGTNTVL